MGCATRMAWWEVSHESAKRPPSKRAIRAAKTLCDLRPDLRTFASLMVCNICGKEDDHGVFRECDENDEPLPGAEHVLIACRDCESSHVDTHPRLYVGASEPGLWWWLCDPCQWRDGVRCGHPDLKANGGPGLRVSTDGSRGFVCGDGWCQPVGPRPVSCVGRKSRRLVVIPGGLSR